MSWLGHPMAVPRIRVHVPVNLLAETFAVLTTHGLVEKAELLVAPPTVHLAGATALCGSNARACDLGDLQEREANPVDEETTVVQLAGAAAFCGYSDATSCDHVGLQAREPIVMEEETTVVNEKRQLAAHPSSSSTVDTAPSGTGTVFYSIADGGCNEPPQHQQVGFAHLADWEEDYSDGLTECFDPVGGDGLLAGHNLDELQWYHDDNANSMAGTSDRADIAATHTAANGGSLECTDPPGLPCTNEGPTADSWDHEYMACFLNALDRTGQRFTGQSTAFVTSYQKQRHKENKRQPKLPAQQRRPAAGTTEVRATDVELLLSVETAVALQRAWTKIHGESKACVLAEHWTERAADLRRGCERLRAGKIEPVSAVTLINSLCDSMMDMMHATFAVLNDLCRNC